jgi:hypothetical protein
MLTLEEMLTEREQRLGKNHPAVQMLRNQITAEKSGKTFQELYLTGSVKKQPSHNEPDFVLDLLKKFGLPLTRENYLGLAYPEGLPEGWGAEGEAGLPEEIRKAQ